MNKKIYKEDIWKIISEHVGEDNAITQYEISTKHYLDTYNEICSREIRRLIRVLREQGYPILSSPRIPNGGYFIPNNYDEVKAWQKRMHVKAVKLLAIVNPVVKSCQDIFPDRDGVEQLNMFKEVV